MLDQYLFISVTQTQTYKHQHKHTPTYAQLLSLFANLENAILHECIIEPSHLLTNLPDTVQSKCNRGS